MTRALASTGLALAVHSLPDAWLHPTRGEVNTAIWAAGIAIQIALVYVVFRRGVARGFPGFAVLAVFYPLRSALLFALSGRLESDDYNTLHNALSLAEAPLQLFVAIELLLRRMRETGGWTARRIPLALLMLCAPFVLTALTMNAIPSRVEHDRVPVFMGFVMLVVFAAIVKGSRSANAVQIGGGFALFALAQFAALAGRAHAMLLRDTSAYLAWGYVPAVSYLAIVLFWTAALKQEARATGGASRRVGIHVVSN
jgi:hypothetical protein